MYKRSESIEEERLDWKTSSKPPLQNKDPKIEEVLLHSAAKPTKIVSKERQEFRKNFDIKRKIEDFLDENSTLFLIFNIFVFPYIIGFLVSYILFYFYGGITIENFLEMQQLHFQFEFWGIGAYLFVTAGVMWFFFKSLVGFFKKKDS